MADINVKREGRQPKFYLGWIGLGILILGVIAWLIYSFMAAGEDPQPVPIDLSIVVPELVETLSG